jgi:hypothetical protein
MLNIRLVKTRGLRGCFSSVSRYQHDVQFEFAAYGSGLLPFTACTVLGCRWHRHFNKSLLQPNPRRSLPLTRNYRQHGYASICRCLSPLKKTEAGISLHVPDANPIWSTYCTTHSGGCLKSGTTSNRVQQVARECLSILWLSSVQRVTAKHFYLDL